MQIGEAWLTRDKNKKKEDKKKVTKKRVDTARIHSPVKTTVEKKKEENRRIHSPVKTERKYTDQIMKDMSEPLPVRKDTESNIEPLRSIVIEGKGPTKRILRDSKGRPVGRMKRVGGTERAPKYEKVKNYDDYTDKELDVMSDDDYEKLEKSSTIKYDTAPKKKHHTGSARLAHGGRPTGQGFRVARFNRGGPAKNKIPY